MTTIHDNSNDELDALLREWHDVNRQRAAAGRDALMQRLSAQEAERAGACRPGAAEVTTGPTRPGSLRRIFAQRYFRAAASLALMATLIALMIPLSHTPVMACEEILAPEAGRLEAREVGGRGNLIGPCALKHTDVKVNISGPFARVTVKQQYHNPYPDKIEAVYTFPLSHRGAVDRMIMTVGERVVEAEIKERQQARQMYESARQAGYVASLLEQERPNIFTQSVANIEPNANVDIEISYVEMLESKDGEYTFDFPMVVAPRYIPGYPSANIARLPAELKYRRGVVLLGPAQLTPGQPGNISQLGSLQQAKLQGLLSASQPIEYPAAGSGAWWGQGENAKLPEIWYPFEAAYSDGSKEFGFLLTDGTGQINNRWFFCDPSSIKNIGTGYERNTDQVPDASRITPMPVRPPTRAGHDISLSVSINTGEAGPAIVDYKSDLHQIICTDPPTYKNLGNKVNLSLQNKGEIPNRDFVLHWRTMDDRIQEAVFTHAPPAEKNKDGKGGFFTAIIAPPARVNPEDVPPRELVFVLDTSGSMSGQPIEKAKNVMSKAIDSMRPRDTFNIITFSGDTHILWERPRPNTDANRNEAQAFLASRSGEGGTEMMGAINAALAPTPIANKTTALTPVQLADLPADGRAVEVEAPMINIGDADENHCSLKVRDGLVIDMSMKVDLPTVLTPEGVIVNLRGAWTTQNGQRILLVDRATLAASHPAATAPLRIVMFLTDGQVGNDDGIIGAVKQYAATARVFSFGIGDSPNRYLLDGIAKAGRGESEYVNLQNDSQPAIDRFVKRIATPVLADIKLDFQLPDGVKITDTIPPLEAIPDLFDVKPLIIHGRFTQPLAGLARAQLKIHGTTGAGAYDRTIEFNLPEKAEDHSVISTVWGRAKVAELEESDLAAISQGGVTPAIHQQIVALGEQFNIMTRFTSFVAVEKARMTIAGRTVLVPIPIELPEGTQWEGFFGGERMRPIDQLISRIRSESINNTMLKVRELQSQLRYQEALQLLDGILFVDPGNAMAKIAREAITTTMRYRDYSRGDSRREFGLTELRDGVDGNIDPEVAGDDTDGGSNATPRIDAACPGDIAGGGGPPDFNLPNGTVDTNDLLKVINNWGPTDPPLVIPLKHANATALADQINALLAETGAGSGVGLERPEEGLTGEWIDRRASGSSAGPSASTSGANANQTMQFPWQVGKTRAAGDPNAPTNVYYGHGFQIQTQDGVRGSSSNPGDWNVGFYNNPDPRYTPGYSPIGVTQNSNSLVDSLADYGVDSYAGVALGTPRFDNAPTLDLNAALNQGEFSLLRSQYSAGSNPFILPGEGAMAGSDGFGGGGSGGGSGGGGKLYGVADLRTGAQYAMIPPHKSIAGPGDRSTSGTMTYPEDWPQLSYRRTGYDGAFPLQDSMVAQKIADTRVPIDFNDNTFEQVITFFENVIGVPIEVEWDALAEVGISRESKITLKIAETSAAEAIQAVFHQLGTDATRPKAYIRDAVLVITSAAAIEKIKAEDDAMRERVLAQIRLIGRLRRVIDRRLWPDVTVEPPYAAAATQPDPALTPALGGAQGDRQIGVAVLSRDSERETINQLKSAGLRVDDVASHLNVIGGTIAADHLDDLALLDCVRRIELVPGAN